MSRKNFILIVVFAVLVVLGVYSYVKFTDPLARAPIQKIKNLQIAIMNEPDSFKRAKLQVEYWKLVDKIPVGVVMTTIRGSIMDANQAYRDMLGYTLAELRDLTYQEITPDKWQAMEAKMVKEAINEKFVRFKKEYRRKDGAVFPIELIGWVIKDDEGDVIGTGSVVKGLTQAE